MRRAALLLLGLPIACMSEAPQAGQMENAAQPRVEGAPVAAVAKATPVAPTEAPADVPRGTSPPSSPAREPDPASYRAIGTEPFWAVTVRDDMLVFERPDHAPLRLAVTKDATARTVEYRGDGFTLTATPEPCSDGMSDAIWSDRVQIAFADGTLKGCGGIREGGE
ncbi:MAG: membrane-like protein [Sphingobium sp.]